MKRIKLEAVLAGRKPALLGAATVAVVGLSVLGSTAAHAAVGNGRGHLSITPGGPNAPLTTRNITWSTTTACPSGENFAILQAVAADNTTANPDLNTISAATQNGTAPITGAQLIAGTTMATLRSLGGYTTGGLMELVVKCSTQAGGLGTSTFNMDTFIRFNTDGTTYTVSARSGPVTPTSTGSPASTSTAAAGTPNGAAATGGGPAPGSDVPMAVGGIALLLVGGGLVLSRWRSAADSLTRHRRATGKPES